MSVDTRSAIAEAARAELARRGLGDFLSLLMPEYERARHADVLIERLEALERRETRRLIVQMPPRHGKTLHVSQALPAWYLGRHAAHQVILASYGGELAESNSRRSRALITDPRWPFEARVAPDSSAVGRWHTTAGGGVIAAGVGGGITGFGAHLLIVDDPVKGREEADSDAIRESTWRWFTEVALTRLMPGGLVLLTQTRWHEDDLAGRVLASPGADDWELLSLSALAEEDDELGREPGEPLWPEWYDGAHLERLRVELGSRPFAALYQQRPTPDQGGVFKRQWLEGRYEKLPEELHVVQAVDSAFKTGVANDYSVIATWATDGRFFFLVDVVRGRIEFPELVRAIEQAAREWSPAAVLVEDTAAGQSAIQTLQRDTSLPLVPVKAAGSKVGRAEAVSPLFEAGRVLLPAVSPPWLPEWIEEHAAFPQGRHDDMVDTTSIALDRLREGKRSSGGVAGAVKSYRGVPRWVVRPGDDERDENGHLTYAAAKRRTPGWSDPRFGD